MIDDYVAYHGASAIYSADVAEQCGVSVRTLGTAVATVRGMSLHRYLRLKQLWSARAQLVKGSDAITVTSCARANGFHSHGRICKTLSRDVPRNGIADAGPSQGSGLNSCHNVACLSALLRRCTTDSLPRSGCAPCLRPLKSTQ